jgi:DNA polymerase delta subunit 1
MKFAVKTATCLGCRTPLKGKKESAVCVNCRPHLPELYQKQVSFAAVVSF